MKKILISTGGSGGHVFPAIALFQHLENKYEVKIVVDKRGSKYLNNKIINYEIINVPNILSSLLKLPINIILLFYSIFKSAAYLKKNNFDILISTGGYMSVPICIAAKIFNVKIYLFEPNMVLGRANKLILKFSKKIMCYSDEIIGLPKKYFDKIYLINPLLRREFYDVSINSNKKISEPVKIIVIGGSQGAKFFDTKIKDLILILGRYYKLKLTQQIFDKQKIKEFQLKYDQNKIENKIFHYDENLFKSLNTYDLAISRSGASAISELCQLNIPFIAVPFPHATDNHQYYNAKYYEKRDSCWIYKQDEFDVEKVADFLRNLISNQSDYTKKKENLNKISYQNTWNNINQKIIELINDN